MIYRGNNAPGIWTRYDTRLLVISPDVCRYLPIEFSNAFIELGYRLLANANVCMALARSDWH
jgi:hypothetical protein